ncbi:uncharacterized protein PG986_013908 [Apiospora aurea]|uniref:F-box domain-containing protein n=1 Tax=Apiospora aurea TaxID=335848 RepID=A0ABR1PWW1_9PEZI
MSEESPNHNQDQSHLLALPGEILSQVFLEHCNTWDQMRLRRTCHAVREIVPAPAFDELYQLELEHNGGNPGLREKNRLYACPACLRLRRRSKFEDKMLKKGRRRRREPSARLCIDCAYEGGAPPAAATGDAGGYATITIQNVHWVKCIYCRHLAPAALDERWKNHDRPGGSRRALWSWGKEALAQVAAMEAGVQSGGWREYCKGCQESLQIHEATPGPHHQAPALTSLVQDDKEGRGQSTSGHEAANPNPMDSEFRWPISCVVEVERET